MKAALYDIMLGDLAPRLGNGRQILFAAVGRKWVHLLSYITLRSARIRREAWEHLKTAELEDFNRERVAALIAKAKTWRSRYDGELVAAALEACGVEGEVRGD